MQPPSFVYSFRVPALLAVLGSLAAWPALAQTPAPGTETPAPTATRKGLSDLSAKERALVEKAGAWLQALGPSRSRFTQTDPRGAVTQGLMYIRRPGKIRFEYDRPSGLLVVSDGHNLRIRDERLNTFSQYPLGVTPLQVLLAKEVRLDRGVRVDRAEDTADGFQIVARDSRRPQDGSLTLIFAETPLRLKSWVVSDAQGRLTRVDLAGLEQATLADDLFQLRPPPQRSGKP